ncbi:MAG: methionine--tRNA ligase [Phycisphaerales bacterium]
MPETTTPTDPYYVTTPIYYVNDRPHIGHCYTTLIADLAARAQRLIGGPDRPVFFLTGTDEHAEKVSKSAAEHGKTPMAWATLNADRFKAAFAFMNFSNDDFVRTTEDRHTSRASAYIKKLLDQGDISLGDYSGWYDPSQEEYLTETTAKEHDYKSPVTGKPLEQRTEQNYFFDLPKHADWLREQIETDAIRVLPEARKNEVLGRIRQGLQRVPVSRRIKEGDADWGIKMPGDPDHRIYVWIEALCNYLTVVDEPDRRKFWPLPSSPLGGEGRGEGSSPEPGRGRPGSQVVHLMAKDILWFHAVIWPCMLRALGETPPDTVYAHAYWIAEGKKMSKSLGNFIEIDLLRAYADRYSLDAVRWFLATQGPLGANDADFAHARFVEVYNADLANGIGNSTSRVANMVGKYFDGKVPQEAVHLGRALRTTRV